MPRPRKTDIAVQDGQVATLDASAKDSLISTCVSMQLEGFDPDTIAVAVGAPTQAVIKALASTRAVSMRKLADRMTKDQTASSIVQAAKSAYRVSRAWEVLEDEMNGLDPWLRHHAANVVLAAEAKRAELARSNDRKIVIAPELGFDDQNLQHDQQAIAN